VTKRVTFISEIPGWREVKLAYGLRRAGWSVTLLHKNTPPTLDYKVFHDARQSEAPWEDAHKIGGLFHNFSWCGDDTSVRILQSRPGRVIFDPYDNVFSICDTLEQDALRRQQIMVQTFCLRKADAIVCRDMQTAYRRKETMLGRGKPLILFPEYCWNDVDLPERRGDGEVHIAQAGYMGLETRGEVDDGSFLIYEKLVNAGCHLHIYMHPNYPPPGNPEFHQIFCDYLALGERTRRVRIYQTIGPHQLCGELSRFDFGASCNNVLTFPVEKITHNLKRYPFCGSSRMFDYLDAGLGLILHRQLSFMWRTFQPYGIALDATEILASADPRAMLAQKPDRSVFQKARENLSIDRNIHRLTKFYEAVSGGP
jgi:hypothetical protein